MDRLKRGLVTSTAWMISPRYIIPEVNLDMPTGKGKVHSTTQILGENLSIWNVCTFSYPRIQCEDVFQGENITFVFLLIYLPSFVCHVLGGQAK